MRRVLAILGAGVLLVTSAGAAAANAPYRETDHWRDVGCWGLATPLGTAEFGGYVSDLYGTDAWLDVWEGEPYVGDPVLTRDWEAPATVAIDGATATLSIPLLPAGTAQVQGALSPVDTIDDRGTFRDGNTTYRFTATGSALAFEGSLTLPGVTGATAFGPDGCAASDTEQSSFSTQPHARVASFTSTGGFCALENGDGDTAELFLGGDSSFLFVDGSVTDTAGALIAFWGEGEVANDGTVSITTQEWDPETGVDLGTGSATLSLVDTGEAFSYTLRASNGFERTRGTILDVEGALASSLGSFDLGACVMADRQVKRVDAPSAGPKPGGKRPANDLPSGAVTMRAGDRATVATRGAQFESEAGYPCLEFTDEFDGSTFVIPVRHTVWYKVAGTGGPVTIDTAGSDFDTVLAAYAGGPDAAATVACLDDVPLQPVGRTLQSAITFDTVAGTTYWVQAGGLDEDVFGPDAWVPYGTLKVAVR